MNKPKKKPWHGINELPSGEVVLCPFPFVFPQASKLLSITHDNSTFAYLIDSSPSRYYQIHIYRLNKKPHSQITSNFYSKPNDIGWITINSGTKRKKYKNTNTSENVDGLNFFLIIAFNNGSVQVIDDDCSLVFEQSISESPIDKISFHFDNCFKSHCPSLIFNCQSHLLIVSSEEVIRTLSPKYR